MTPATEIDSAQSNAMTEVALALAMGFFALMILALVSMGPALQEKTAEESTAFPALQIAPADGTAHGATQPAPGDRFILFWKGQYFDDKAEPVDPATVTAPADGRLILAVDPGQPLTDALTARDGLSHDDVTVTALSPDWVSRLGGGAGRP